MALGHMGREFVGTLVFRSIQNGGWRKALRSVKKAGWRKINENPERRLEGIFKECPEWRLEKFKEYPEGEGGVGPPPAGERPTTAGNFTQTFRQLEIFQNINYSENHYIFTTENVSVFANLD